MLRNVFQHKKCFIGFVTAGDGGIDYSVACCLQLIAGGVDILEIGVPFSDPIADGPVIQQASQRALQSGANMSTALKIACKLRQTSNVPLILFTYFNPLLQKGIHYLQEIKAAGYAGILIVDSALTPDNSNHQYINACKSADLCPILLASPSTTDTRLQIISQHADGFIYYACQKGTTGEKSALPSDFATQIQRIRTRSRLPIAAGFGIADRHSAKQALEHADAFVVGSAFVNLMGKKTDPIELKKMAQAIDPR